MGKKNWVVVALAAFAGSLATRFYLDYCKPGGPPSQQELATYFDGLAEMIELPDLPSQVEEDWVESDGLRLHLDLLLSDPADPALVVVPETTAHALLYWEFMQKMRMMGLNVIGLDPRGHGRSQGRRGSYTMDELVRDTLAAVEYARGRFGGRVAVAGSSQGGIAAFCAAAKDDRLKAAVCHNVAVLNEPGALEISRWPLFSRMMGPFLPMAAAITPELRVPINTYLDLKVEQTRFGMNALEFIKQDPLAVLAIATRALASLSTAPPPKPIEEITVPVMVIQGELDNLFSVDYCMGIFDRLTCEKEFLMVDGASHLVMTNDVDEIAPEVAAWLNKHMG